MNSDKALRQIEGSARIHPLRIAIAVLLLLLLISFATTWYARQVSLPRYCEDPQRAMYHLARLLNEKRPAGNETRRPYIVAAKLLFLIPQQTNETVPDYLNRVEIRLREQCLQ
jgi:hypothetical protein